MGKLTKDKRDIYYRKAKEEGYRARSAYKLLQLDQHFHLFEGVERVIDLCAAPGSWSQVVATKLKEKGIIGDSKSSEKSEQEGEQVKEKKEKVHAVAIDLQEMAPIEGISILQGDITREESLKRILELFGGQKADLVICDGAPDVTGFHDVDQYIQAQLVVAALNITIQLVKPGGTFVAKIFRGKDINVLYDKLKCFFKHVYCAKPRSSRNSSIQAFAVCLDFMPPPLSDKEKISLLGSAFSTSDELAERAAQGQGAQNPSEWKRRVVPFVACGSLSGYDPDMNYPLEEGKEHKEPTQLPINPPYKAYLELKEQNKLE